MINVVVPGKFHYLKYIQFMGDSGQISGFYFSSKSTHANHLKNSSFAKKCHNLLLKEYILHAGVRLSPLVSYAFCVAVSHILWRWSLKFTFKSAQVNFFLLHGACIPAIRQCKKNGKLVVGELVNIHPIELDERIQSERKRLGLPPERTINIEKICHEISLCDYILAPSEAVAKSVISRGFPPDRVKILPYGIDSHKAKEYAPRSPAYEGLTIVCAAQLNVRKGIHLLLDAVQVIRARGISCRLTIVGAGDPTYKEKLFGAGIQFEYIERLPNKDLVATMQKSSLLVLPSIEDGFGLVVAEALSVGTPVVVSKYAGASQIVVNGINGYVVDPFVANDLADKILLAAEIRDAEILPAAVNSWAEYSATLTNWLKGIRAA